MTFRSRLQRFPKSVTPFWGRNRCDLKWKADSSVPGSALALCIALSLACGLPVKSLAGTLCESSAVEDYLPPLPHGCQRKRIEAAGNLSFGILRSAETLGLKAWQHQVLMRFGERFQDWKHAVCKKVECSAAVMEGSRRCLYSAYPCSPEVDLGLIETLSARDVPPPPPPPPSPVREAGQQPVAPPPQTIPPRDQEPLTPDEIKELQQHLADAGYHVGVDGHFGDQTRRALIKWQQTQGFPENGSASRENLERLRRHLKS